MSSDQQTVTDEEFGTYDEIRCTRRPGVTTVWLHRPERRNAYTSHLADEVVAALSVADADDDVRVVVLTGSGRDFTVGADLDPDLGGGLLTTRADEPAPDYQEPAGRVARRIYEMNKPVIAAVRGAAVGAGSTIILPADYRLAGTDTRFGYVFTRRGIVPEGGSTWFLPRLVGLGTAMDWMISGRVFGADEAKFAGLVHSVHLPDEVLAAAYRLADELIANTAPVSVAVTRQLLHRMAALESPFPVHRLDSRLIADAVGKPDVIEGVGSFLEHRPPDFPGRVGTDLPDFLPWRGE